jgi:uncharacterized protein HemY
MPKEHVVIFALLCIIAFGAGYWHSSPKGDSDERAEVVASRGQRMNKFDKTSLLIFLTPIAIAVVVIVLLKHFVESLLQF